MGSPVHHPVLVTECLELLQARSGAVVCDATVGLGGHAEAILEQSAPQGRVVGIDRDPAALAVAGERLARYQDRISLHQGTFDQVDAIIRGLGLADGVDGLLLDLGVSSLQLDDPERGFSFSRPGPLDMRMDQGRGETASGFLARLTEAELARVLKTHGEQPRARAVARAIKQYLSSVDAGDTAGLARVIAAVLPRRRAGEIHPATRAFMAIRIALNDELGQLERFLERFTGVLAPGARVLVITFHSLEDRLVKRRFASLCRSAAPPELPLTEAERPPPEFILLTRRSIQPGEAELAANPRARSARLRAVQWTPWTQGAGA
jgi:16S rRNA (cytosine1402-N4)-methyltransferase